MMKENKVFNSRKEIMFGNVSFWVFWKNGYTALAGLDDNHDNKISDKELLTIGAWIDTNQDGISEISEIKTMEELKVKSINLSYKKGKNGIVFSSNGITFTDEKIRPTYDWISHGL